MNVRDTCSLDVANRYVRRLLRSCDKQYGSWVEAREAEELRAARDGK